MRRIIKLRGATVAGLVCCSALAMVSTAFVAPAGAGGGSPSVTWAGKIERDHTTFFAFGTKQTASGKQRFTGSALFAPYHCRDGDSDFSYFQITKRMPIDEQGRFGGNRLSFGDSLRGLSSVQIRGSLHGRLNRKTGRARGTLSVTITGSPARRRGGDAFHCYTGELDWQARRGQGPDPTRSSS